MAAKKTYMNPEDWKQAAASKDKPRKGVDGPEYENITLTFRNQDQPKESCSPPKSKDSEMSQELLVLKRELWNVSVSAHECQEKRKQSLSYISQKLTDHLNMTKEGTKKLKTLSNGVKQIEIQLQQILKMLPKMSNQQPTPQ